MTNLITNHTFSNLVLRPPSLLSTGYSPDEPQYKALGARMTDANDYANWASFQLYDTSGSIEDWSYWQTGGYGFTFEIGTEGFHPEYQNAVVAEYLGLEPAAGAGKGGNREAYYRMAEATIDPAFHSTIKGTAPAGRVLTVSKSFQAMTSPVNQADGTVGDPIAYQNDLSSSLKSKGGKFTWAVNPSTRPVVAGRWGRDPVAPAQPTQVADEPRRDARARSTRRRPPSPSVGCRSTTTSRPRSASSGPTPVSTGTSSSTTPTASSSGRPRRWPTRRWPCSSSRSRARTPSSSSTTTAARRATGPARCASAAPRRRTTPASRRPGRSPARRPTAPWCRSATSWSTVARRSNVGNACKKVKG